jgi:hypothetical protein
MSTRLIMIGIVFILIFLTGFLLSRIGRPYSNGTLTVHKLLGLAALALFVLTAIRILRTGIQNTELIPGVVLTVLVFFWTDRHRRAGQRASCSAEDRFCDP